MLAPPGQSFAVQLGYTFTPSQSPPPELELLEEELELEVLDDELEVLDEDELELVEELLELLELELDEPPPNSTSTQLKKRS